jgi:predicted transposase/invertase (TIGR01784 family)
MVAVYCIQGKFELGNGRTDQEMWAIFFRYMSDKDKSEKLKAIIDRKEGIKMAANVLYEISQDEKARIQYENELIADLDTRSWVSDAWEEGMEAGTEKGIAIGIAIGTEKGKEEMARNLIASGISPDIIAKSAGLPLERIQSLVN